MKHVSWVLLSYLCIISFEMLCNNPCELSLESSWNSLDTDQNTIEQCGGKWILAGTITIKKRCEESLILDEIILQWKGSHLKNLSGSLYKKNPDKRLLPIEENLISDSYWHEKEQKLILKFNQNLLLQANTILCLVLTVPEQVESFVRQGHLELEHSVLPNVLRQSLQKKHLILSFNKTSPLQCIDHNI